VRILNQKLLYLRIPSQQLFVDYLSLRFFLLFLLLLLLQLQLLPQIFNIDPHFFSEFLQLLLIDLLVGFVVVFFYFKLSHHILVDMLLASFGTSSLERNLHLSFKLVQVFLVFAQVSNLIIVIWIVLAFVFILLPLLVFLPVVKII